jgi:hypothetical protein
MKIITIFSFFVLLTGTSFGQTNAGNYLPFYEGSNTARYYKMGKSAYLDYFLADKVKFGDHEYYAKIRKYSWGDIDTSYYREDDKNYYHFDPRVNGESVVLPKAIEPGQKWFESDGSWSYEIIGIDEKLKTPAKEYKGLLLIECLQLTGRDKEKYAAYNIYYAKGIGMVASVNNGKLTSYLFEVKKNVKEGEKIGD